MMTENCGLGHDVAHVSCEDAARAIIATYDDLHRVRDAAVFVLRELDAAHAEIERLRAQLDAERRHVERLEVANEEFCAEFETADAENERLRAELKQPRRKVTAREPDPEATAQIEAWRERLDAPAGQPTGREA